MALILTRRVNETLVITTPTGEEIRMTVLGVKGNQVRIGSTANTDVTIDREEIHERKLAEKNAA